MDNYEEARKSPLVQFYIGNDDVFGDRLEQWHTSGPEETRELHEYLGLTWDEYGYLVNHEYFDNRLEGETFIAYLKRTGMRMMPPR